MNRNNAPRRAAYVLTPVTLACALVACGGDSTSTTTYSGKVTATAFQSSASGNPTLTAGYYQNATVFLDTNGNGVQDSGEPVGKTDASGNVVLGSVSTGPSVMLASSTCLDSATGLALATNLTSPQGGTTVSPLSTVVQSIIAANPTTSVASATSQVATALGLGSGVDVTKLDPYSQTAGGGSTAPLAALVQVAALVAQSSALLSTQSSGFSAANVYSAIASAATGGGAVNLTSTTALTSIITQAAQSAGVSVSSTLSGLIAAVAGTAATTNTLVAAAAASGTGYTSILTSIAQLQYAVQTSVASSISSLGNNPSSLSTYSVNVAALAAAVNINTVNPAFAAFLAAALAATVPPPPAPPPYPYTLVPVVTFTATFTQLSCSNQALVTTLVGNIVTIISAAYSGSLLSNVYGGVQVSDPCNGLYNQKKRKLLQTVLPSEVDFLPGKDQAAKALAAGLVTPGTFFAAYPNLAKYGLSISNIQQSSQLRAVSWSALSPPPPSLADKNPGVDSITWVTSMIIIIILSVFFGFGILITTWVLVSRWRRARQLRGDSGLPYDSAPPAPTVLAAAQTYIIPAKQEKLPSPVREPGLPVIPAVQMPPQTRYPAQYVPAVDLPAPSPPPPPKGPPSPFAPTLTKLPPPNLPPPTFNEAATLRFMADVERGIERVVAREIALGAGRK